MQPQESKPYKKQLEYSYALGAFATHELLAARPGAVSAVYLHPSCEEDGKFLSLCGERGIPVYRQERIFRRVSQKDNLFVIGQFSKYREAVSPAHHHVVLVNPSDMGNLGTIIRTMTGFGLRDLAIVTPAADIWNPKVVRSSMGALFRIRFQLFSSFEEYRLACPAHRLFPFVLDGGLVLGKDPCPVAERFSLIFGNEATGLDAAFSRMGQSIRIAQSPAVDSFNLSVAAGIGMFLFSCAHGLL